MNFKLMDLKGENSAENNSTDILNAAQEASASLLPVKSKERYEQVFDLFCEWRNAKKVKEIDENVMLAYFYEKVTYLILVKVFYILTVADKKK
jgi:hypothetical protein